jgi:hypothetical protein
VKQAAIQHPAENYVKEVLTRFPDVDSATDALFQWARHDVDLARTLGIHFLDTVPPFSGPLKSRIRAILESATRPEPTPESEELVRAREEFVRNFRP